MEVQADELFLKMKGGESTKKFANIAYLWNYEVNFSLIYR
jgi:hypothetical protein